ncbi:MAG: hypothetical protein IPP74_03255 [Alphaproteobacteria bacterium]|nr:hypothetical protein [Alphaproteobacteria bacterium]
MLADILYFTLLILLILGIIIALILIFYRLRTYIRKRPKKLERVEKKPLPKPPSPLRPPIERLQDKELEQQRKEQLDEEKVVGIRVLGFWTELVVQEKSKFIQALLNLESLGMKASSWVTRVKAQANTEVIEKDDPYYFRKLAKSRSSGKGGRKF